MIYKLVLLSAAAAQSKRWLQTEGGAAASNLDMAAFLKIFTANPQLFQQIIKATRALAPPAPPARASPAPASVTAPAVVAPAAGTPPCSAGCVGCKWSGWVEVTQPEALQFKATHLQRTETRADGSMCKWEVQPKQQFTGAAGPAQPAGAAGQTPSEKAKAECAKTGKVANCGATCQAYVQYQCVCPAGQVATDGAGPCVAEAAGKPTPGDANPKAWNPFAPITGTSKVTTPDANTDVEWALVDGGYVQACKYKFAEPAWETCGAKYDGQKVRTLSAAVEQFSVPGYQCVNGAAGTELNVDCTR